jgi:ABC-type Fe3+-hydroxamate transport system substrate-binding protein
LPSHTPRRIACLQPSATAVLEATRELDRVVACTRYCAEVVPAVGDGSRLILADSWTANANEIISARPELVIAAVPYQEKAVSEILKSGARFLGLAPKRLADIYTDIATIAGVVGASERGERVIASVQQERWCYLIRKSWWLPGVAREIESHSKKSSPIVAGSERLPQRTTGSSASATSF